MGTYNIYIYIYHVLLQRIYANIVIYYVHHAQAPKVICDNIINYRVYRVHMPNLPTRWWRPFQNLTKTR